MDTANRTYVHGYSSGALGEGARIATATITAGKVGTEGATVQVSITAPSNMVAAELTDYQAFVNLLDEEATELSDLVGAAWPPA